MYCRLLAVLLTLATLSPASERLFAVAHSTEKIDPVLRRRLGSAGRSQVIIRAKDAAVSNDVAALITGGGGTVRRRLPSIESHVAVLPDAALDALAANPSVRNISLDRMVVGATERTSSTVGARLVRDQLGVDGSGVGIAVIDSGVTAWHDDLADSSGIQRVDRFVSFVGDADVPYDDYGHGTHVAGIIAGNGLDSGGARAGMAPGARLIVLKVLDAAGRGRVSDVIAAMEYAVANRDALNIRIINLSIAAAIYESYETDPLTVAAQQAVGAGIVVVAAAGNNGVSAAGRTRYGGVTAPGNAPWVLTVGASSHEGTIDRADDTIANFSSRGPAAIDHGAKPDISAPGVGIESLSAPGSSLSLTSSQYLLAGTSNAAFPPYLSLSGTSMAAPVVTGTVALMLQANPSLTPNEVKAILQFTAQVEPNHDPLTQGAGLLNAKGAVELAKFIAAPSANPYPDSAGWSGRLIWGNYEIRNGRLTSDATAWPADVMWGASTTPAGNTIDWGVSCSSDQCESTDNRWTWIPGNARNVVWGSVCGGSDCAMTWTLNAITGATDLDTVVWGTTDDGETVVWGTIDEAETVVWGTAEGDTVVWGTGCSSQSCVPTIWGQ